MTERGESLFSPWWKSLEQDGADRAALRRCSDPVAAMMVPAYHRLYHQCIRSGFKSPERIAVAAAVLSHVRIDVDGRSLAAIARNFSEPRFRRLVTIDDISDLQIALIRAVRMNDSAAPVESLGRDIQFWGNTVKQRWAFDFYEEDDHS